MIVVAFHTVAGCLLMQQAFPDSTLPEPSPLPSLPAANVQTFIDAAAENGGVPHMIRYYNIKRRDRSQFLQHFRNISAQRGWYAFPDQHDDVSLVYPFLSISTMTLCYSCLLAGTC